MHFDFADNPDTEYFSLEDYATENFEYKLDKLWLTADGAVNQQFNPNLEILEKLQKLRVSKALSFKLSNAFLELHTSQKNYIRFKKTLDCLRIIDNTKKDLFKSYCGQRHCLTCNRIKTGKYINQYNYVIESFKDPRFLTLTVPNPKLKDLKPTILKMLSAFRKIKESLRHKARKNHVFKVKGIRKLEITYNAVSNTYHPHFHIISNSEFANLEIIAQWKEHFPDINFKAQDEKPADAKSLKEIFKYFTKIAAKNSKHDVKFHLHAIANILDSLNGIRIIQGFGVYAEKSLYEKKYNTLDDLIYFWNEDNFYNGKNSIIEGELKEYVSKFGENFVYDLVY
jgi:hypothetical protein